VLLVTHLLWLAIPCTHGDLCIAHQLGNWLGGKYTPEASSKILLYSAGVMCKTSLDTIRAIKYSRSTLTVITLSVILLLKFWCEMDYLKIRGYGALPSSNVSLCQGIWQDGLLSCSILKFLYFWSSWEYFFYLFYWVEWYILPLPALMTFF